MSKAGWSVKRIQMSGTRAPRIERSSTAGKIRAPGKEATKVTPHQPEVHTSEQSWLVREADPDVRHENTEDRAKPDRRYIRAPGAEVTRATPRQPEYHE